MGCNSQRNPKDSRCHLSLRAVSGQPFARRANINRKLWTVSRDWRYGNRGWTRAPYRPCEFVSRRRRSEKNWSSTTLAMGSRHYARLRSEEHTSELQSQSNLVCRLLLEKK